MSIKYGRKPKVRLNPVLKNLSRRLILFYTLSTGLILCAAMCIVFFYLQIQKSNFSREAFLKLTNSIESKIHYSSLISDTWLSETESSNSAVIYIEDNGNPFYFAGAYSPRTDRAVLLQRLHELLREQSINPDTAIPYSRQFTGIMSLRGDHGDRYFAALLQLASSSGWQSVYLIQEISSDAQTRYFEYLLFLALALAGVLLLFLISRISILKTLRPVDEAERKQREFIAAASHELRSPLTIFRMNLSAARKEYAESDLHPVDLSSMQESLGDMEEEAARMAVLVDDLLLLASGDAGSWTIQPESFDTDAFLLNLCEAYEPVAKRKGLCLIPHLPDNSLPVLHADKTRLRQVLEILLNNACSYAASGKTLELAASACVSGKYPVLLLQVIDHGPGIPDKDRKLVFDRFYRCDQSRQEKAHYGLGLSIAYELIRLHGGTISCSETPGGGAVFTVELPLRQPQQPR